MNRPSPATAGVKNAEKTVSYMIGKAYLTHFKERTMGQLIAVSTVTIGIVGIYLVFQMIRQGRDDVKSLKDRTQRAFEAFRSE